MSANENLTGTTELEAVNMMLAAIGEAPVQSLNVPGVADLDSAVKRLREVSRSFQKRGWKFNRERNALQARDENGFIVVPANALHFDISKQEARDGVVRGNRLYDVENATFVWDRDVRCDVIYFIAFDELPEAAREYIAIRATRVFQRSAMGSETLEKFTQDDERRAWADWLREEARAADRNVFRSSSLALELNRSAHFTYIPYG